MSTFVTIIIYLATVVLVIDSLFLILLVLIQLPKKEAGAGLAFGGGTTDALFGAGSGNALTNITKYAVVIFFVLSLGLSILQNKRVNARNDAIGEALKRKLAQTTPASVPMNNLLQGSTSSLTNAPKPAPSMMTLTPPPVAAIGTAAAPSVVRTVITPPGTNSATPPKK